MCLYRQRQSERERERARESASAGGGVPPLWLCRRRIRKCKHDLDEEESLMRFGRAKISSAHGCVWLMCNSHASDLAQRNVLSRLLIVVV